MSIDLTEVFSRLLSRNLNRPDYGICASSPSDGASQVDLVLTFKSGAAYCCAEPGCHLPTFNPRFWERLRAQFQDAGYTEPSFPMTLRITGIVEDGAILGAVAETGYRYVEVSSECKSPLTPPPP